MEDIAGDVRLGPELFALAKAQATGNPLALEKAKLENEIKQIAFLDRANQLARHRNRQELDQRRLDLDFYKGQVPIVEQALETIKAHEVRDPDGKLLRLRIEFDGQVFATTKEASEYLKAHPKVDERTKLESTRVEYRSAGEWHDAPKGEEGKTTAQSLVTSVLMRSRDLGERLAKLRSDVTQSGTSVERLEAELAKPSAYGETLKALQERLEAVSAELSQTAKAEEEIVDAAELDQPDSKSVSVQRKGQDVGKMEESAAVTFGRHADELQARYGHGVAAAAADLIVAGKMADAGWATDAIEDAVADAGFRKEALTGPAMREYAAGIAAKASLRAAAKERLDSRDQATTLER